jgi:hypothetical protein
MATVEDKEIPGGLLSFFRSYEHVYSIIFVFCFTSRVICGLFFFFGALEFLVKISWVFDLALQRRRKNKKNRRVSPSQY